MQPGAIRIGHGVRCLEDAKLTGELRRRQILLEVCPSSNVCLQVVPEFKAHPLPKLLEEGLYVTLNTDDPPMFNTNLNSEFLRVSDIFNLDAEAIDSLLLSAGRASLLPESERQKLLDIMSVEAGRLKIEHL